MHVQKVIKLEGGNEYKEGRARLGRGEKAIVESLQNEVDPGGNGDEEVMINDGWEFEEDNWNLYVTEYYITIRV